MSHAATKNDTHSAGPAPGTRAATARDAAGDQLKLLLLLAGDWLDGDRQHHDEIAELVTVLTPPPADPAKAA